MAGKKLTAPPKFAPFYNKHLKSTNAKVLSASAPISDNMVHTQTHTDTQKQTHKHTDTHIDTQTHTHRHTDRHLHTQTDTYTYTHIDTQTDTHIDIQTDTHTHQRRQHRKQWHAPPHARFTLADLMPRLASDVVGGKSGQNHPTSRRDPIHIGRMTRNGYIHVGWYGRVR